MTTTAHHQKTSRHKPGSARERASAGPGGIAITPPASDVQRLDFAPTQSENPSAPSEVVQRWKWPWQKADPPSPSEGLSARERQAAEVGNNIASWEHAHRRRQRVVGGASFDYASPSDLEASRQNYDEHNALSHAVVQPPEIKSRTEKAGVASSGVSKLGTLGTHIGQVIGNDTLGTAGRLTGGAGAGLGVAGSLLSAGVETHDILTSHEKKKDKAIRGMGVLGSLANATNSGASGVQQITGLVSGAGALSSIAGAVAAPAGLAKGGADVVAGLATGGLAHYRSNRLQAVQDRTNNGVARFAQESQWNKAKSNYGRAAGGALGVAGGALLLAGLSNPIGWGLLALGGLVGLGVAGYKMYKKHQQGKQMLDPAYRDALEKNHIDVRDNNELGPGGWKNIFKTKSMRRQEMVRGSIAMRLAENEQRGLGMHDGSNATLNEVAGHLGIRRPSREKARLLEGPRDENTIKRARAYARALDY